ncbi:hypothetical protein SDC9_204321 [bioreactor metagenome]|uniref:Uncharacterized protein n=1 Tax=bioreactor metagenome TaxID=1076179 RepID=A0A645IZ74_9ZZZZ
MVPKLPGSPSLSSAKINESGTGIATGGGSGRRTSARMPWLLTVDAGCWRRFSSTVTSRLRTAGGNASLSAAPGAAAASSSRFTAGERNNSSQQRRPSHTQNSLFLRPCRALSSANNRSWRRVRFVSMTSRRSSKWLDYLPSAGAASS